MTNKNYPGDPQWVENLRQMHPFKLAIYVSIVGIIVMFLFVNIGFIITKNNQPLEISKWFTISSIIILFSSYFVSKLKIYYTNDKPKQLLNGYLCTLFLGVIFGCSQLIGWYRMYKNGYGFSTSTVSITYIYLLSALHLFHFLAGIVYVLYLILKAIKASKDTVYRLVFSTDPYESMLIELCVIYWHFMGILWLVLYFSFLLV